MSRRDFSEGNPSIQDADSDLLGSVMGIYGPSSSEVRIDIRSEEASDLHIPLLPRGGSEGPVLSEHKEALPEDGEEVLDEKDEKDGKRSDKSLSAGSAGRAEEDSLRASAGESESIRPAPLSRSRREAKSVRVAPIAQHNQDQDGEFVGLIRAHDAHESALDALEEKIEELNIPSVRARQAAVDENVRRQQEDHLAQQSGSCAKLWLGCKRKASSIAQNAPRTWEEKWLLVCGLVVLGVVVYLFKGVLDADGYNAEPFHPGQTIDDSINDLGQEDQDQNNQINNVWPYRTLVRIGVASIGSVLLMHLLNHFTSRRARSEHDQTRRAGDDNSQIIQSLKEVAVTGRVVIQEQKRQIMTLQQELANSRRQVDRLEEVVGGLVLAAPIQASAASESGTVMEQKRHIPANAQGLPSGVIQQFMVSGSSRLKPVHGPSGAAGPGSSLPLVPASL